VRAVRRPSRAPGRLPRLWHVRHGDDAGVTRLTPAVPSRTACWRTWARGSWRWRS